VRWSGTLPAGKKTNAMLAVEDLFPTLLKLTGVSPPQGVLLDGKDFSACLTGDAPSPRQERCWLWITCDSIRTERHKLIRFADHRELYDLQSDPAESKNLAAEQKDLAADLERRLNQWQKSVPIYPSHVAIADDAPLKPEPAGDVLEVRAVREEGAAPQPLGLQLGQCERFAIGSGDRIEYDLLLAPDSASQGVRLAISPPLNRKKAARGAAIDEDDDSPAAATGDERAGQKWTRRSLGLANFGGKMLNGAWLIVDAKQPATYHMYLDNVVVRRADGSVIPLYRDGKPPEQRNRQASSPAGYSQVAVEAIEVAKVSAAGEPQR
jgi:hypothetical protein